MSAPKNKRTLTKARPPYTSRIIKAGALLADTKTLLLHWDNALTVRQNLDGFRRENLFGKASRSRMADVLAIFRQRYLGDPDVAASLAALVKHRMPPEVVDKILFFCASQSDRLLHDTVAELLAPRYWQGLLEVLPSDLERTITQWVSEGKTAAQWSAPTVRRVVQGLLATLRDFGVLEGAVNKRVSPAYLLTEAFAYIAFALRKQGVDGRRLIEHPDWRLFLLAPSDVEHRFLEADRDGLLIYQAAGQITRIEFSASSLKEMADVLARRSN